MTTFAQIIFLLLAIFIAWRIYHYIKTRPEMFSQEQLGRSFFSLGILALLLIGFVTILVMIVKSIS